MPRTVIQPLSRLDSAGFYPILLYYQRFQNNLRDYHRKHLLTSPTGLGYRPLGPSNLISKKGIEVINTNLQFGRGSLQGGDGSGVVYENVDPNQGTLEFWVGPYWNGNDGVNHFIFQQQLDTTAGWVVLQKYSDNLLYFKVKSGGSESVSWINVASLITAGNWYHVVGVWDIKNALPGDAGKYTKLYLNQTTSATSSTQPGTVTQVASTFSVGSSGSANQFNGVIADRILNRPLTSTEVTALYASGAGHTDTFCVTPDVVWMGDYSANDDDAVFWHRGQRVIGTTTTSVTVAEDVGLRSYGDNVRLVCYDGCGDKRQMFQNGAAAGINIPVDDGAGGAVTGLDKVGVGATLNGTTQYFSKTDNASLSITGDLTIQGWIKIICPVDQTPVILGKWNSLNDKRSYMLRIGNNVLDFYISNNGIVFENKIGTIAVNDGKWHFVAAVYDATAETVNFYVDGYLDRQQTFTIVTGALNDNDSELRIGASGGIASAFFNGSLRNIQLFNDKRITTEILTDATNPMADNSGDANNVSQWLLTDAALVVNPVDSNANANHLTLNGGDPTNYGTHSRTQQDFLSKNLAIGDENGGIGGIANIASTWNISKSTSVVKFDTRSIKGVNTVGNNNDEFTLRQFTLINSNKYFYKLWVRVDAIHANSDLYFDIDGVGNIISRQVDTGNDDYGVAYSTTVWRCFYGTFTADSTGNHNLNIRITGAGVGTNSITCYFDNIEIRELVLGNTLVASTYYTLIYDVDLGTTGFLWTGLGSQATEIQAGDLYIEDDRLVPSVSVPGSYVYSTGKWSDAIGSTSVDEGKTLYFPTSGRIQNNIGTVSIWTYWQLPYNKYTENKYIWEVENVFRAYYNKTDYKFYFQVYNGANWTTVSASSSAQSFSAGTWIHLAYVYNNTIGISQYINGSLNGNSTVSWVAQALPTNAFIGSSYDGTKQICNRVDDFRVYNNVLDATQVNNLYLTTMEG